MTAQPPPKRETARAQEHRFTAVRSDPISISTPFGTNPESCISRSILQTSSMFASALFHAMIRMGTTPPKWWDCPLTPVMKLRKKPGSSRTCAVQSTRDTLSPMRVHAPEPQSEVLPEMRGGPDARGDDFIRFPADIGGLGRTGTARPTASGAHPPGEARFAVQSIFPDQRRFGTRRDGHRRGRKPAIGHRPPDCRSASADSVSRHELERQSVNGSAFTKLGKQP